MNAETTCPTCGAAGLCKCSLPVVEHPPKGVACACPLCVPLKYGIRITNEQDRD